MSAPPGALPDSVTSTNAVADPPSMIPTRTQVNKFQIARMGGAASQSREIGSSIDRAANLVRNTIAGLDWSGKARSGAVDRANREHVQYSRSSSAFEDLADAITDGQASMGHISSDLISRADGLEKNMYEVSDTWDVKDAYNYTLGYAVATATDNDAAIARLDAIKAQRETERKSAEVGLKRLAGDFNTADTTCSAAVTAANAAIASLAPAAAGVGTGSANTILDQLNAGEKLTPTQLQQLQYATSLSPQQLDALRRGKPAEMTQSQYDFLKTLAQGIDEKIVGGFTGSLDSSSAEKILTLGHESQREQIQRHLANGVILLGAPGIYTKGGDQGGMGAVPQNMRLLLTERPVLSVTSSGTQVNAELYKLTEFITQGDRNQQLGSDINRAVLKQVSEISAAAAVTGFGIQDTEQLTAGEMDRFISRALEFSAGDKLAAHDFITGTNMDVTCANGGRFNANDHLDGLFANNFGDETEGLNKLVSWIGSDATNLDAVEASRAHSAANAIGHYLGSGGDNDIVRHLGVKNPLVAQEIAKTLSPYLLGFNGSDESDNLPGIPDMGVDKLQHSELARVFASLDSDPDSAAIINKAGKDWQNYLAYMHGLNPDTTDVNGLDIGRLADAMSDGYQAAGKTLEHDALDGYNDKVLAFSVLKDTIGLVPYAQYLTPVLQDSLIEPPDSTKFAVGDGGESNDIRVLKFSQYLGILETMSPEDRSRHIAKNHQWFDANENPQWDELKDDYHWHKFVSDENKIHNSTFLDSYQEGLLTPDNEGAPDRDRNGNPQRPKMPSGATPTEPE